MASNNTAPHILVGVTGGIAAGKVLQVVSALRREADVRVVMTQAATSLVAPLAFESMSGNPVAVDTFSRDFPHEIQHISWAQWADAFLIAPATANTIGKLACGIADNLLTTTALACPAPLLLAPAMNCAMYTHPAVQENLTVLRRRGAHILEPDSGPLACGDTGIGRLPEPPRIVEFLWKVLHFSGRLLEGTRVLVTAGPTCEPIDPVRFLTNRSSGKMGYALAEQAAALGAKVTLISGPVALAPPADVETVHVETAREMLAAVLDREKQQDVIIACAAVSDYEPAEVAETKMKKKEQLEITLKRTPDILAVLGEHKHCCLVGFAAETNDVLSYAKSKLERKNLDMIVANDVSGSGVGFGSDDNEVTILTRSGDMERIAKAPKREIALSILHRIASECLAVRADTRAQG